MSPITYGTVRDAVTDARAPFHRSATGYGPKIPTRYRVRLDTDSPTARYRRVYVMQYGNSGSAYVIVRGEDVFIRDGDVAVALERP